jgi:uncharacterized protein (DUF58 family)
MAGQIPYSDLRARLRRLQWWLHEGSGAARAGVSGHLRQPAPELVDHRPYTPGDDPRYLDWRLFARLRRPFVRRGEARRGATLALVVDASASMGIGDATKLTVAVELAAALAYLHLEQGGQVGLHVAGGEPRTIAPARGQPHLAALLNALEETHPEGRVDLGTWLPSLAATWPGPTHVTLLSDLLQPVVELTGLGRLVGHGHHLDLLQILDRADTDPDLDGPCRLVDPEGHAAPLPAVVDASARAAYRTALATHADGLRRLARRHRMRHLQVDAARGMEAALLAYLRLPAGPER